MSIDFAIIGAQKSASSSLHWLLSKNRAIYTPWEETSLLEDFYFTRPKLQRFVNTHKRRALGRKWGIKRPTLLYEPNAANRLSRVSPDIKLIICFRDPAQRALSACFHYMRSGLIPVQEPNKALLQIFSPTGAVTRAEHEICHFGLYSSHLQNWLNFFKIEQFLFLTDEDLQKNCEGTLSSVESFLSVPQASTRPSARKKNTGVYSLPRLKLMQMASKLAFKRQGELSYSSRRSPKNFSRLAYAAYSRFDEAVLSHIWINAMFKLQPRTQSLIAAYYKNEPEALGKLINRDLSAWNLQTTPNA